MYFDCIASRIPSRVNGRTCAISMRCFARRKYFLERRHIHFITSENYTYPSLPQNSLIKTCKIMTGLKGGKVFFLIDNILLWKKGEKLNYQIKTNQTIFSYSM